MYKKLQNHFVSHTSQNFGPDPVHPEEYKLWTVQHKKIIMLNIRVFKNKTDILDVSSTFLGNPGYAIAYTYITLMCTGGGFFLFVFVWRVESKFCEIGWFLVSLAKNPQKPSLER